MVAQPGARCARAVAGREKPGVLLIGSSGSNPGSGSGFGGILESEVLEVVSSGSRCSGGQLRWGHLSGSCEWPERSPSRYSTSEQAGAADAMAG